MTEPSDLRRFDFQDARRLTPNVSRALSHWQGEICTLLTEAWGGLSAHPIPVTLGAIDPLRCVAAMNQLADPGVGVILPLGQDKLPTLMAFDPALLPALCADLLGSSEVEGTADRALTPLEDSLFDLLLGKIRESIADAWPGQQPLPCSIKETCRPKRTRRLSQYEEVIAIRWKIACRFHTGEALWLVPRKELEQLVGELEPIGVAAESAQAGDLRELAEQFPLEVTIELGAAAIGASALSRLEIGDVLILDQPLNRPLTAHVAGEPVWLVEPCRVGQRQAVSIHSLLEG